MLIFLGRWLKGLILGWLMAFIFFLIKRAMKRAFGNVADFDQQAQQDQRTGQAHRPPHSADIIETLWDGMSTSQLVASYGQPDQKYRENQTREIWTYMRMTGRTAPTEITIENGSVTKWQAAAFKEITNKN